MAPFRNSTPAVVIGHRRQPTVVLSSFWQHLTHQLSTWHIQAIAQILDVIAITLSSLAMMMVYLAHNRIDHRYYLALISLAAISGYLIFSYQGLYRIDVISAFSSTIKRITKSWIILFFGLSVLDFLIRPGDAYSRVWAVLWFASGYAGLLAERFAISHFYKYLIRIGVFSHSIVLLGASPLSAAFIRRVRQNGHGVSIDGVFDDRKRNRPQYLENVPVLGGTEELLQYVAKTTVNLVVLTLPQASPARIREVACQLRQQPVRAAVLPGAVALELGEGSPTTYDELPGMYLLPLIKRPITGWSLVLKGIMDRLVALIAILAFSPVLLLVALAIKFVSPGPVLFRQDRQGYKGNAFSVYKFRTMHIAKVENHLLTQRDDPRVYSFGSFLRRTSIDELPQLFNVLKGEMSLVGPRPHMPTARAADRLYFEAVAEYASRHRVKPGITGWAQVNGWRGPTETVEQLRQRVEHDLYYIDHWSLLLDIKILLLTVVKGFSGKNAF